MRRFISFFFLSIFFVLLSKSFAQIDARILRYPDVSKTHITFVYGNDIWIVSKNGGTANKLSSPKGTESFPKFSPDGSKIAFSGNYDGNTDLYVVPAMGGMSKRLSYHGFGERLLDWYPDGNHLLFNSVRYSGRLRYGQFYKTSVKGGLAEKLPLPYGEFGSISEDSKWIAYTKRSRAFRTWKRYRGGTAPDIWLFNLKTYESENITNNDANNEIPMWFGNKVYYISDDGSNKRFNIWFYDTETKVKKQITKFKDFDIHFPSIGKGEIVFEAGGILYLLDLNTEQYKKVDISVITDNLSIRPHVEKPANLVFNRGISSDGKRAVIEARGDLFSLPAEHGPVINLTNTSGVAERYPAWSPDGKYIAYWSDKSGEYELTVIDFENGNKEKKLTSYGPGYRYKIYWSPNSEKLAFIDQTMTIRIYDMKEDKTTKVDQGLSMYQGALNNFKVSWSSDSKWLAYSRSLENQNNAIFIYDSNDDKVHQVTSGYYSDASPAFDPDGKYLYFLTNRELSPLYSDLDNTFVYPNTTQLAAVSLRNDVPSPLAPRNDEAEIKKDEEEKDDEEKDDEGKDDEDDEEKDKKDKDDKKKEEEVKIDIEGFESRLVVLPPDAGNMTNVQAVSGKVLYHRIPNSGSTSEQRPVKYYDIKEREEKTVFQDADFYLVAHGGKKVLVGKDRSIGIIDLKPEQKMDKKLRLNEMEMIVNPRVEWKQIFTDAWRLERDMFYDDNMHGVNWKEMKKRYGKLIDYAITRTDVNYIIGELIAELSASHTYRGGGDSERPNSRNVGYLGVDWKLENGAYKIDKIIKGAQWDAEVRSPLDQPGVEVKEGDYVLAVNGVKIDATKDPYAGFQGLGGKTIELTVNDKPDMEDSKKVIVEALTSEVRLRHLAWIEKNRKRVEEATNGKIGYIYVRSTGRDGQTELLRQFVAQRDKLGLIVDERFNSGGQIPDRFIELLDRKPLAFWAVRDGMRWQWPPSAVFGPKVMLINGWSGSGGDAFPDYFRKAGLGPLIGTRTWGGLIGITGAPTLIDGGRVTVPTFRMYDPDGKWFLEGHGVDPDIEVDDDPTLMAKGTDPQLERAIEEVMKLLKTNPPSYPDYPSYEKR
ncbi:PDZ domain-containing protein [Bacteroidota bacterium]